MKEMLQLQSRFSQNRGARVLAFLESKRFRAAYDLMLLRAEVGDCDPEVAAWWTHIQGVDPGERRRELDAPPVQPGQPGPRRRRGRRRGRGRGAPPADNNATP
jgi:poly(A) polymerase